LEVVGSGHTPGRDAAVDCSKTVQSWKGCRLLPSFAAQGVRWRDTRCAYRWVGDGGHRDRGDDRSRGSLSSGIDGGDAEQPPRSARSAAAVTAIPSTSPAASSRAAPVPTRRIIFSAGEAPIASLTAISRVRSETISMKRL
jgi:hypothetical protein